MIACEFAVLLNCDDTYQPGSHNNLYSYDSPCNAILLNTYLLRHKLLEPHSN